MIPTDRTGTARAVLAVCTVFELRPGETDSRIPGAWKFARNAAAAKRRPAHRPEAAAYRVCVDKPPQSQTLPETHDTPVLENDILRAEITPDGKLDLLHKAGGRWYRDVLTLEDTADTGHSYISLPLAGDAPVGPGEPVSMKYTRDAVCQEAVLSFLMRLPEALNEDRTARSSRLVACPVTLTLRLHAGEPFLRASWQIENRARDHRLRMLVRTGLDADATTALYPHSGEEQALFCCDCLQTPLLAAAAPVDTRKFLGGRPALQEAAIAEFFYQDDPYPTARLPRRGGCLSLPSDVQMTALKKSEDRQAYVLRFFSTRKEERLVPLHLDRTRFSRVEKSDLQERAGEPLPLDADGCAVPVKAGEIVTLRLIPVKGEGHEHP